MSDDTNLMQHFAAAKPIHRLWTRDRDTKETLAPIGSVRSGETFTIDTINAFGRVFKDLEDFENHMADPVAKTRLNHPVTGPVKIEGADAQHGIAIHILGIEPSRAYYCLSTSTGLFKGQFDGRQCRMYDVGKRLDGEQYIAIDSQTAMIAQPSIGVVATLDDENRSAGRCSANGGNMDIPFLGAGSTVYLPVNHAKALIGIGDAHLYQGAGEISGMGIEADAKVTLRAEIVEKPPYPIIVTPHTISILGWGADQTEASRKAAENTLDYLTRYCSLNWHSRDHLYQLLGGLGQLTPGNLTGNVPTFAVHLKRSALRRTFENHTSDGWPVLRLPKPINTDTRDHAAILADAIADIDQHAVYTSFGGKSRTLYTLKNQPDFLLSKLQPVVHSRENAAGIAAPKTDLLRATINAHLCAVLDTGGVKTDLLATDAPYLLVRKHDAAERIEVVVKRKVTGSPKHSYKGLFDTVTRSGHMLSPDAAHAIYVRFDWRNPPPDDDAVMPQSLARKFIDTDAAKRTAFQAFQVLRQHLHAFDLDLDDCCFFMNKAGTCIIGEVSPDNLGTLRYTGPDAALAAAINDRSKANTTRRYTFIAKQLGLPCPDPLTATPCAPCNPAP